MSFSAGTAEGIPRQMIGTDYERPQVATTRVCVLTSSYEGSSSETTKYDDFKIAFEHFMNKDDPYTFDYFEIKKATTYREIRGLVKSGKYDVYFNLCDGARDEDRAGEEVVRTLEEYEVPFTGAASKYYEMSKSDMKMVAQYCNIPTARHAVVDMTDDVEAKCAHLTFPVIVKHISGYASIGMTAENKCLSLEALHKRVRDFVHEYEFALVEEFIAGDEATVLVCADDSAFDGVRVFHPALVSFPPGSDFKYFELKWSSCDQMEWRSMPYDDPALEQVIMIGRRSFKEMMGGIGYGRCDIRIDRKKNQAVFLEINPNCGIMYPPGAEGSADIILKFESSAMHQREFAILQIEHAIQLNAKRKLLYYRTFDNARGFHLRAIRDISKDTIVFEDEGRSVRIFTKPFIEQSKPEEKKRTVFEKSARPLGSDKHFFAVWDTNPVSWRPVNQSHNANLCFAPHRSLNVVASRDISKGEELTMKYDDDTSGGNDSTQSHNERKRPRTPPC